MRPKHMLLSLQLAFAMITSVASAEKAAADAPQVSAPPTASKPKGVKPTKPSIRPALEADKRPKAKPATQRAASSVAKKTKFMKAPLPKVINSLVPTELPTAPTAPTIVSEDDLPKPAIKAAIGGLAVTGGEVADAARVIMNLRSNISASYDARKPPANSMATHISAKIAVNVQGTVEKVTLTAVNEISEVTKACVTREFQKLKFTAPDKSAIISIPIIYRDF